MFAIRSLVVALWASSIAASPIQLRQSPNAVLKLLNTTLADLKTLNKTVSLLGPFNPANLPIALLIQTQANKINDDLTNLGKAASQINGVLSYADSITLATAVDNLEAPVISVLNNIVSKKPEFSKTLLLFDLSKTVLTDLQTERRLITNFGNILIPHIEASLQSAGPELIGEFQAIFDKAIAAYQKCSGLICLPPITLTPPKIDFSKFAHH